MASTPEQQALLDAFLLPINIAQQFLQNLTHLSAESLDQFLPTPISESILRPVTSLGHGR